MDWRKFLKAQRSRSAIHFIDEYFADRGEDPTPELIKRISEDELLSSWISINTMKEIQLLQQNI
jgi:hypothetical protein